MDEHAGHGPRRLRRTRRGHGHLCFFYFWMEYDSCKAVCHCVHRSHLRAEHDQHPRECWISALHHLAQVRHPRAAGDLGAGIPAGIVVTLCSVRRPAQRVDSSTAGTGRRAGSGVLLLRRRWDVSKIAGEVKDPARTLPRALVLGVVGVVAAYVLVSGVFLYLVPLGSVTNDQTFVAQAGAILFGRTGANLLAGAVIVCVLGSLAALFMLCPRVYYAMARHGVFIHSVAELHPVFATPMRAIGIQGIMASLLVALGAFDQIIAYFIFVAVLFIGLTVSTVFVFRRRERGAAAVVRTPGYPFTPLAFLGMVLLLLTLMMLRSPRQSLLGCAVVLLGIPVYAIIQRQREATVASPEAILKHALDRQ